VERFEERSSHNLARRFAFAPPATGTAADNLRNSDRAIQCESFGIGFSKTHFLALGNKNVIKNSHSQNPAIFGPKSGKN
jgi:hypothetical protein